MDIYEVYLVKRVKINGNFLLGLVYIRNLHKVKKKKPALQSKTQAIS
jgi:hypothetical protein